MAPLLAPPLPFPSPPPPPTLRAHPPGPPLPLSLLIRRAPPPPPMANFMRNISNAGVAAFLRLRLIWRIDNMIHNYGLYTHT